MDSLAEFGKKIGELRKARGLSREKLADRAGISSRFLASVESGRGNIALSRLLDLCSALGMPLAFLAAGVAVPPAADDSEAKLYCSLLELMKSCSIPELEEALLWLSDRLKRPPAAIALVGLRGAGKTSIGQKVAFRLKWDFVELDERIESRAGLTLQNIFELHGEEYYRALEEEVLKEFLTETRPAVLATGGGIVTRKDAYDLLDRHCLTFWLKAHAQDHWDRVMKQDPRPMTNVPNAFARLRDLLERREPLYARAHWTIDTSRLGIRRSVARIVAIAKEALASAGAAPTSVK